MHRLLVNWHPKMRSFAAASAIKCAICRKSTERQWKLYSSNFPRWKLSFSNLRVSQPQEVCVYAWKHQLFMFSRIYVTYTFFTMNFGFAYWEDIWTIWTLIDYICSYLHHLLQYYVFVTLRVTLFPVLWLRHTLQSHDTCPNSSIH